MHLVFRRLSHNIADVSTARTIKLSKFSNKTQRNKSVLPEFRSCGASSYRRYYPSCVPVHQLLLKQLVRNDFRSGYMITSFRVITVSPGVKRSLDNSLKASLHRRDPEETAYKS